MRPLLADCVIRASVSPLRRSAHGPRDTEQATRELLTAERSQRLDNTSSQASAQGQAHHRLHTSSQKPLGVSSYPICSVSPTTGSGFCQTPSEMTPQGSQGQPGGHTPEQLS